MRFCFYLGYKDIKGGYTTLLLTLIRELKKQNYDVVLFNYPNGLVVNELKNDGIEVILIDLNTFDWKEVDQFIYPTDIFIISKFLEIYQYLFKINPKFIYYDINDFIGNISEYKFGIKIPFIGKLLIKKLLAKKSLIFMDDTGVNNIKNKFSIHLDSPEYLPIPVKCGSQNLYLNERNVTPNTIKLTYIGRAVEWKIMPLKKILEDCAKIENNQTQIHFTTVTDSSEALYKFIDIDSFTKKQHLSILIIENLLPSEIDSFLLNNSDLHFAMGTAALEAAKLGIPTILMDYSINDFKEDYTYRWLYETENFSLGRNLDKMPVEKGMSMEVILSDWQKDNSYRIEKSRKSFKYIQAHHSSEQVVNKLVEIANDSEFRIKDAKRYIPYYYQGHQIVKTILKIKSNK